MHKLAGLILRIMGWKLKGEKPHIKRFIIAVAPHTSSLDFIIGRLAATKMKVHTFFLMKKELFFFPLNIILQLCKGIPVDRKSPRSMLDNVAKKIEETQQFALVVTPEGTRKKTLRWKKGFYYIAKKTGTPVLPAAIDYQKKELILGSLIYPGENETEDLQKMLQFYQLLSPVPKNPEKFKYPINIHQNE